MTPVGRARAAGPGPAGPAWGCPTRGGRTRCSSASSRPSRPASPGPLATSVARLIVEATATDVCFVHVLDDNGGALTLMGATPPFDRQVGRIRLPVGEGVSGWVASHRTPAVIAAGKEADPRYRYFPELGGQAYTSMVSVPMESGRPGWSAC